MAWKPIREERRVSPWMGERWDREAETVLFPMKVLFPSDRESEQVSLKVSYSPAFRIGFNPQNQGYKIHRSRDQ